jgi:hypothetical protein
MAKLTCLLAHGPGFPEGDTERGLDLSVTLTAQAQIDAAAFEIDTLPWPARRFWPDREDWHGELIRVDEGWAIRAARGDNEPLWDFEARVLRPGEYVILRRPDGEELVFRIVGVDAG